MVYFGLYHNMKDFIPSAKESPTQNLLGRIALGFTAGSLASLFNIPFDVAKSRIQGYFLNCRRVLVVQDLNQTLPDESTMGQCRQSHLFTRKTGKDFLSYL